MTNKPFVMSAEPSADKSIMLAEAAAMERLLNAYLRETETFNPTIDPDHPAWMGLPASVREVIHEQGVPMKIELKVTGRTIWGAIRYLSSFGHHRYGSAFWVEEDVKGEAICRRLQNAIEMAGILLREMAAHHAKSGDGDNRVRLMLDQIHNSVRKTEQYVRSRLQSDRSLWDFTGEERMLAAEQSLIYGHPFHPTPKSAEGFEPDDLSRYAPEMGASFSLHYFAVDPELVEETLLGYSDETLFPDPVLEAAKRKLAPERQHFKLLPVHPWQAQHVKQWPPVQQLIRTGQLIDLGEQGNRVYPTSSVRTVWDPTHAFIYKLPLNVRITNFVRVNPPEQVQRTVDAGRVLARLNEQIPYAGFTVLLEAGYRTLSLKEATPEERKRLAESLAVIFRENPLFQSDEEFVQAAPTVVAALLEQPPSAGEAPIWEAVRLSAKMEQAQPELSHVQKWLKQYLKISLVPILWLFLEHGVSMEAHVQNAMVTIQDGWPVHFYVRDLEGVSISRERVGKNLLSDVADDSPALYSDREAWHRLKYYVFVNHLGHLIHTLAFHSQGGEVSLWQTVGEVLRDSGLFAASERKPYLMDLLEGKSLPAKANWISCFQKRGETPLYVDIPNPLASVRWN
jgi:siderophore synthetase component